MNRWYVVHTQPSGEDKAAFHLRNQGFEAYLPRYRRRIRHARREKIVLRPLFPRYLFVRLDLEKDQWRSINGSVGVSYIMCNGDEPLAVPQGVIEGIVQRESEDGAVSLAPQEFSRGERVFISEGPFAEYTGIFEEMTDDMRVILLLDLMGRKVRVKTPIRALSAAS